MRIFLNIINVFPHAEEHPEGASRSTHEVDAARFRHRIQQRLTDYACSLDYAGLSPEAIHAAKVRIIDTLGALIAGFFAEPCRS